MMSLSPPSSSSSLNLLAPGFRFHPTDEELVSYYLKRKVSNLPLRVDAIAEIDLYKWEPRDLPSLSRLRSRDMEWFFFSPLDRKYSNRSRTNRATAGGYWKTTGKDRPVRHRSEVVGMKKTLVFHEGRAPRGERTNWVMHEYRLGSDDSLQGPFVLCRIFQKNGAGPQNGAQYGAPFIEEEWEEAQDANNEAGAREVITYHGGEQDYVHSEEEKAALLLEKSVEQDGRCNNQTLLLVADTEGQIGQSQPDDPTTLLEDILDLDRYINAPGLQDGPNKSTNNAEDSGIAQQFCNPSAQNDEYMELQDIFDTANVPSVDYSFEGLLGVQDDYITAMGANEGLTMPEEVGSEFPSAEDFLNPVADYTSYLLTEDDMIFYDAPPNDNPSFTGDIFADMNSIQFSPAADFSGFDVDDLMAYFNATDNNLPNDILNPASMTQTNFVPEVEGEKSINATNLLEIATNGNTVAADMRVNEGWNAALRRRAVNMLGSISAPPAKAECSNKGKVGGVFSATHLSSSIRVSSGMIRDQDITVMGASQKNGEMSFLLSYGVAANDAVGKRALETQSGVLPTLLRGGFHLFGLSLLFLSISFCFSP